MKNKWLMRVMMLAMVCGVQPVSAEEAPMTPLMVSLWTPVQVPSQAWDVNGCRLSWIYGRCQTLYGLDVGLVSHTVGSEAGLSIGIVNYVEKDFTGLNLGLVNYTSGEEISLGIGLVNYAAKDFTGLDIGLVNTTKRASAVQIGLYNGADDISGIQIGLINHARLMRGLQIGVVNVIENNDLTVLPIVNFFF